MQKRIVSVFNNSLEENIVSVTDGPVKTLLVALLQGNRSTSNQINENDVQNDARTLFEAGEKRWDTEESKFIEILCNRRQDFRE